MRQTQRLIIIEYPRQLMYEKVEIPIDASWWHHGEIIIVCNGERVQMNSITVSAANHEIDEYQEIDKYVPEVEDELDDDEQAVYEVRHAVGPLHHDYYRVTIDAPECAFTYSVWAMMHPKSKTKQASDADYKFELPDVEEEQAGSESTS